LCASLCRQSEFLQAAALKWPAGNKQLQEAQHFNVAMLCQQQQQQHESSAIMTCAMKQHAATVQVLDRFCKGFNGTVLAYGQTGVCLARSSTTLSELFGQAVHQACRQRKALRQLIQVK
jgi:hypothetical protein